MRLLRLTGALALSLISVDLARAAPVVFTVQAPASVAAPLQGRMLVFAQPLAEAQAAAHGGAVMAVDAGSFNARGVAVAGQDVDGLHGGQTVAVDADVQAFPQSFSSLPPGRYAVQAVLDRGTPYNYAGRGPGDLVSEVATVDLPAQGPAAVLHLGAPLPERDPWTPPANATAEQVAQMAAARADIAELDFTSPALSRFWGRPTSIRGWIVAPPGYRAGRERYPVVYWTHGFGGTHANILRPAVAAQAGMASGKLPPMIWVFLDEDLPTGTHEFADSVNNGPWGTALTTELIPELERTWRMDARPSGRFLTGHSSGGWATLWLQVRYPKVFGGSWPTSPDPSTFHDFTGVDAYAPGANVYRRADSTPYPLIRDHGQVLATLEDFTRLEEAIGPIGGQQSSFDWVFSPKGTDGRPMRMFDRATGAVDPQVLTYWREHYDVAEIVRRDWPTLRPDLDGKIHLTVGTADTFYLDGAAHKLDAVFQALGAHETFRYLPGRTHGDLYRIGDDRQGLTRVIAWEMYAVARPGVKPPADLPKVPTD